MPLRSRCIASLLVLAFAAPVTAKDSIALSDALIAKVQANPDRSYPPSCLSFPLPTTVRGTPVVLQNVFIGDFDSRYEERVTITAWRAACSSGKSAVLVKFTRAAGATNATLPDVPVPFVTQGTLTDTQARLHFEPNTYNSEVHGHSIVGETTLVLEQLAGGPRIDFNQAFKLSLGTIRANNQAVLYELNLPAYNAAQHPDGTLALEIGGHVSGSWYDAARSGEGMIVEVGERANGGKYAGFAWYTFDPQGNPSWIVGNQDLPAILPRTVTIPALYIRGGGFAGNFNPTTLDAKAWGTVTLTFPTCNTMRLDYASAPTAPAGAPVGSGTRNWQRLVALNGLVCE
ncbi:MAG TPA: hypothetical protein VND91_05265 [Candidatus Saccharimonadia bacterium]|nr:hypothetical protein [Candidatus Saccharimonadia bacterium]